MLASIIATVVVVVLICFVDFSSFFLDKESGELLYAEEEISLGEEHGSTESANEQEADICTETVEEQHSNVADEKKVDADTADYNKMVEDVTAEFIDEVYKEV